MSQAVNNYQQKIEGFLQKHLKNYFIVIFITTITAAFYGYLINHQWKIGDWLINYQGGMIRRGLLGELVYQLSYITNINPGIYILALQILLYGIFLFFSYHLLKKQRNLLPYSILIVSPFIFTFQINDLVGGFRKEIIYIALLAFITWAANVKEHKSFEKYFYITLFLYPAVILTHEMLAIFLPYLLVVYVSVTALNKKKLLLLSLLLLPNIVSFLTAMHYSGEANQIKAILNSLSNANYVIGNGAITWLNKSASFGINKVVEQLTTKNYIFYLLNIIFASVAFIPLYQKIQDITRNKLALLLIITSMIGSIGLFLVAIDWGRFIYIHLISIFFLLFIPTPNRNISYSWFLKEFSKKNIIIFFVAYSLFWSIPHAGSVLKKTFRQPNFISFLVPYFKVTRYYIKTLNKKARII